LCSCRPSPVLSAHPVLRARAYSDWSPLTVPRTRARTVVFLQIGNCTSYHRTVRASRCTTSAARIVRCRSLYPIRMSSGANSVLCCVSRLLALRVSSHPPRPAIPRILRASRVTWAHALCMQPLSTPLTRTLRPSSDPFWEQEILLLCVDGHPFSQPSLRRNVLRLAHSWRF